MPLLDTPLTFFGNLIWRSFRWRVTGLIFLAALGIGLMSLEPIFLRGLLDALDQPQPEADKVCFWFFAMVLAWFGSAGANRLREWLDIHTAPELRLQAQLDAYHWLDLHSPQFFQNELAGGLSQKVKQVGTACVLLSSIVFNGFVRMCVAIIMAAFVLISAPSYFFWVFVCWLVLFSIAATFFAKRSVPLFKAFGEEVSASTGLLADINGQMDLVRSNAQRLSERRRLGGALLREKMASVRNRWFLLGMILVLYSALIGFQCLFIGLAVQAFLQGQMRLAEVVMVVSLATILITNVWALFEQLIQFFEQVGILASALRVIARPHEVLDVPGAAQLSVRHGEIRFENVTFAHPGSKPLFQNFSCVVAPGEQLGLVGPSGAGKSTLIKLLRRQADLQAGRILIDGQDIALVSLDSLNAAMADVPQDPALFHRSLRENIVYGRPDVSEHELHRALEDAQCASFVAQRPEGLDVRVGERGIRLSGGERQRVALARAFVKNAPIILLDEATSALDSNTEALIKKALTRLCEGRTVVAIAHRLSTLTNMDRILVLVLGQIAEQGTHSELMAINGHYAKLWTEQAMPA